MNKPFSQACENNKQPILAVLKSIWQKPLTVLEVGSGTGQHAVFFAEQLPHINWQASDQAEHLPGIQLWLDERKLPNIKPAVALNVSDETWPFDAISAVFTANTLHIMSWQHVEVFFQRLGKYLIKEALFISYGPFNKHGQFTSDSNANFDQWLKQRDPLSGIRDMEALTRLAGENQITLINEIDMPANNKILVWKKN